MAIVVISSPTVFEEVFNECESIFYVLFVASEDPETGQTWCPDCNAADPVIRGAIPKLRNTMIV